MDELDRKAEIVRKMIDPVAMYHPATPRALIVHIWIYVRVMSARDLPLIDNPAMPAPDGDGTHNIWFIDRGKVNPPPEGI